MIQLHTFYYFFFHVLFCSSNYPIHYKQIRLKYAIKRAKKFEEIMAPLKLLSAYHFPYPIHAYHLCLIDLHISTVLATNFI